MEDVRRVAPQRIFGKRGIGSDQMPWLLAFPLLSLNRFMDDVTPKELADPRKDVDGIPTCTIGSGPRTKAGRNGSWMPPTHK